MRILYLDIDSLRPDHLGCYGYRRPTSPHIDKIAEAGIRFENIYASDTPCLPSRTALFSGRFGFQTGVVGHGGTAADPFVEGPSRGFGSLWGRSSWTRLLRNAGLWTASVSPFAERHAAWHFAANWNEQINTGRRGLEDAKEIAPVAIDWLERKGREDNWFLHVNLWDPHTPYRADDAFFEPFQSCPLPPWPDAKTLDLHLQGCGPHSAAEATGFDNASEQFKKTYPKQPDVIDSQAALRALFDGYDAGVRCADFWFGRILETLSRLGIKDDVALIVSGDHGENLGELNIYADHMTADSVTPHVPLIVKWPGVTDSCAGQSFGALHYQFDFAATVADLLGQSIPASWDGISFASALTDARDEGRDHLIISHGAWTCQRSALFEAQGHQWICIRTYHDGYHAFPEVMLFNLSLDPYEERECAGDFPDLKKRGLELINDWTKEQNETSLNPDPMDTVLREGGPKHTLGELTGYLERLRATGRGHWADLLEAKHG